MGYTKSVIVFIAFCLALGLAQYTSRVEIPNVGTLQGAEVPFSSVTVNSFVGIPYAAPPVGDLRFQYPQAAPAFSGVFDATRYGNICPQVLNGLFSFPNQNLSEDCLTLNIWAPNTQGLKPVLFWIHAGAFIQGSGSELRYHGDNLAAQENVVVVTINYRLGALGTLAHPSLDATYNNSGSYILADQAFAFQWVINNIQYFGGDNSRITLGGISAGGASTTYLLANELYNEYISQAIVASADPVSQAQSKDSGLDLGVMVASLLTCNGTDAEIISCLRNASFDQYINLAPYAIAARVSVDGVYLMDSPYNLITQGKLRLVPTYAGNSLDELTLLVYPSQTAPLAQPAYRPFLATQLTGFLPGVNTYSVAQTYPCADYDADDCRDAASVAISDGSIFCQTSLFADRYASFGYVYSYRPSYVPSELGTPHLSDIPFHFNSLNLTDFQYGSDDQAVANIVSRYFGSFITNGDPNYNGAATVVPDFQPSGNSTDYPRINFVYLTPTIANNFKTILTTPACQYWETVYGQLAAADLVMQTSNSSSAGGATPNPSPCPVASPVPNPSPCPAASPCPSNPTPSPCPSCPVASPVPNPSPCPAASPCPSNPTASPSPCPVASACPACPDNAGTTNINFYFADMLNGVKAGSS